MRRAARDSETAIGPRPTIALHKVEAAPTVSSVVYGTDSPGGILFLSLPCQQQPFFPLREKAWSIENPNPKPLLSITKNNGYVSSTFQYYRAVGSFPFGSRCCTAKAWFGRKSLNSRKAISHGIRPSRDRSGTSCAGSVALPCGSRGYQLRASRRLQPPSSSTCSISAWPPTGSTETTCALD